MIRVDFIWTSSQLYPHYGPRRAKTIAPRYSRYHQGMSDTCWISTTAAPHASELLSAKRLEFCAAGFTETAKKVERPAICHLPQLGECLVRLQVCIEDRSF